MSRFQLRAGERLHWRAIVRTTGALESSRGSHSLMWHLVECADPARPDAHCPEGLRLLSAGADPDGHCLVDAECPRCAVANASAPPATAAAVVLVTADTSPERSSESPAVPPVAS